MSETFEKWIPVLDTLLNQVYYRVLSFVSFHAPVDDAFQAAQFLASNPSPVSGIVRGGEVVWFQEPRIWVWRDLTVFPGISMTVWGFGSMLRRKNTVLARAGWWKLWVIESLVSARTGRQIEQYFLPTSTSHRFMKAA